MSAVSASFQHQLKSEARAESLFRFLTALSAGLVLVLLAGVLIALFYGG